MIWIYHLIRKGIIMLKLEDYIVINKKDLAEFINTHFKDCSTMDDAYCRECQDCRRGEFSVDSDGRCWAKLDQDELAYWFVDSELEDYILNEQTLANMILIAVYEKVIGKENDND